MRLGQLARKYDLPVQEVISYLESESSTPVSFHANSRLDSETETQVLNHFDIHLEEIVEPVLNDEPATTEEGNPEPAPSPVENESDSIPEEHPEPVFEVTEDPSNSEEGEETVAVPFEPKTPLEDIALAEGEIALPLEKVESDLEDKEANNLSETPKPKEDEVIQTDQLLELLESEEEIPDLEKIKLIKASKRELSGLKVLGKVDLPEPKKKEGSEEEEKDHIRKNRGQKSQLSEEERERRRLKAKRKKEAYEARQEKRRKEKEAQRRKAQKEAHYKQKLERTKTQQVKQKQRQQLPKEQEETKPVRKKPKTVLGRFWYWMTHA